MKYDFTRTTSGNRADFLIEGQRYYDRYLELIEKSENSIHLQTYIFDMDEFGEKVHVALIRAAARGVRVHMLIDSVGSQKFPAKCEEPLKEAGVHFFRFNGFNLRWLYQWSRRLHHKILLIDYEKAIVGGINVTTSGYGSENSSQQLDFALYLEGPVIYELSRYCQSVFRSVCNGKMEMQPVCSQMPAGPETFKPVDLKISINDWVYSRWQITQQYTEVTRMAKKDITIVNSYFFPRKKFIRQLLHADQRGVKVRLILPKLSDWPSYILASQYLYSNFLGSGVEIYEWKKSVLHGKLATVDGQFSTVGSFNLNYTSYQQNLEMNIDVLSADFTKNVNGVIDEIIKVGCEKVNLETFIKNAPLKIKFLRFFYYILLAMIANFSVSLTYREEDGRRIDGRYNLLRIVSAVIFLVLGLIGALLPVIPGFPFLIISFLLVYRQLLFNRKINV